MVEDAIRKNTITLRTPDMPIIPPKPSKITWIPFLNGSTTTYNATISLDAKLADQSILFCDDLGQTIFSVYFSNDKENTISKDYGTFFPGSGELSFKYAAISSKPTDTMDFMLTGSTKDNIVVITGSDGKTNPIPMDRKVYEAKYYKLVNHSDNNLRSISEDSNYTSIFRCSFSSGYLSSKSLGEYLHITNGAKSNFDTSLPRTPFSFSVGLVAYDVKSFTTKIGDRIQLVKGKNMIITQLSAHIVSTPIAHSRNIPGWFWDNGTYNLPLISFFTLSDPHTSISPSPLDVHTVWNNFVSTISNYIPKVVDLLDDKSFSPCVILFQTKFRDVLLSESHYDFSDIKEVRRFIVDGLFDMPNWMFYRSGSPLCSIKSDHIPHVSWALITLLSSLSQSTIYSSTSLQTITSGAKNVPLIIDNSIPYINPEEILALTSFDVPTVRSGFRGEAMSKRDISRIGLTSARNRIVQARKETI